MFRAQDGWFVIAVGSDAAFGTLCTLLEVPALAISSTECRKRVGEGLPLWYLVPDGVVQYVAKRGLYTPANEGETLEADIVDW